MAVGYVAALVMMPLVVIVWRTIEQGASAFWDAISSSDAVHAYQVTVEVAGLAVYLAIGLAMLARRRARRSLGSSARGAMRP